MINIGIIGCGKIAQKRHIPEYLENVDANLVGFYDLNQARAKEISETFGGNAFNSIEDLLADPSIDAVSVCTANHTHAAITIQALQAGKHVLCEKPMATTLEDCQAMVDAANKAGKVLVIGQNQRLTKTHKKARELIRNGEIGQIIGFRTTFGHGGPETWSIDPGKNTWFFDKNIAVMGAMADLGIHKTDLLLFLSDQKIVETTAHLTTIDKRGADGELIKVDDTAICVYQLENGAIGTMTASWTFYGPEDNTTIIYGTKGIMRLYEDPQFSIQLFLKGGEKIYHEIDMIQTNENQTSSGVIDAFVESVITGQGGELAAEKVLESMKVIFASIESSQTGKTIKVK
ncbi:MAG: Gfo/Idh/MocA family oxidoreductase [Chloroflexi bacterium]|nr:Gfo/Idh/MocA family oxidoreductase [Chloroflexota bacterium]